MSLLKSRRLHGWILAMIAHGALIALIFSLPPPPERTARRRAPVKVSLVKRPVPPKPAQSVTEPPAMPVQRENRTASKWPRTMTTPMVKRPRPAAQDTAPAPRELSQERPAAPPRKFVVSMDATVAAGGVDVPVSTTGVSNPYGSQDPRAVESATAGPDRDGVNSGRGVIAPVSITELTSLPKLVVKPSSRVLRENYPQLARRDGLEGNVRMKILVSATGKVEVIRILKLVGNGFDKAAAQLIKKFHFKAGTRNGKPVAVWIPWTYKFRLDG